MVKLILFGTKFWRVELNRDQAYLGRCVVVLKRECSSLSLVKEVEMVDFLKVIKKIEKKIKKVFGAEIFNWSCLMNNSCKDNDEVAQVHWHVRPRYREAVVVGGKRFVDKEFGHHYDNRRREIVSDKVLWEIVGRLGW
ncbi:MAG: HIT domain-containing protein [Nanoarchaeota archaeon]|nr:HIT domain-containing protein [Nanoarchaeota archaeon]